MLLGAHPPHQKLSPLKGCLASRYFAQNDRVLVETFFSIFPFFRCALRKPMSDVGRSVTLFFPTDFFTEISTITKEVATITKEVATITKEVATITGLLPLIQTIFF